MTLITHNCKTVAEIRVRKLGELKAGLHLLVVVVREGLLEEVKSE